MRTLVRALKLKYGIKNEQMAEEFASYFEAVRLKKNEHYIKSGETCNYFGFVAKGLVRGYYKFEKEVLRFIIEENYFVTDLASLKTGSPAMLNIQFITDGILLQIHKDDYFKFLKNNPEMIALENGVYEQSLLGFEKRVLLLSGYRAEKRYELFVQEYPRLHKKLSLQHVASFLNIRPETLSRIKKNS